MSNGTPEHPAAQSAKTTRRMVDATIPILIAAVCLPLVGQVYLAITEAPDSAAPLTVAQLVLAHAAAAAPSVLLTFAMLALRRVLVEYERGQFLSSAASESFTRVGYWAVAAMVMKLLATPVIGSTIRGERSGPFEFETFDVSLLLFGALVAMVGTAFATAAAAIKADNDQIV